MRFRTSIRLLGLLAAVFDALGASTASGTTVVTLKVTCPACGRELATHAFGSWFQGDEPFRDMSGSMFAANHRPITCPRCLFSVVSEFGSLDNEEVGAVKKVLANLRSLVRPLPPKMLERALSDSDSQEMALLQIRIAEACDRARKPDAVRSARLRYAGYLRAKILAEATILVEERKLAIQNFEASVDQKSLGNHQVLYGYLAGELNRRAGNMAAALVDFQKVKELGPAVATKDDQSLFRWAEEQAMKARAGNSNAESIAVTNAGSYNAEKPKLREEAMRRLPEMLAALRAGRPRKEWLRCTQQPDERIKA